MIRMMCLLFIGREASGVCEGIEIFGVFMEFIAGVIQQIRAVVTRILCSAQPRPLQRSSFAFCPSNPR